MSVQQLAFDEPAAVGPPAPASFFRPGYAYDNGQWTFTCERIEGPNAFGQCRWNAKDAVSVAVRYDETKWSAFKWSETKAVAA